MSGFPGQNWHFWAIFANNWYYCILSLSRQCRCFAGFCVKSVPWHFSSQNGLLIPRNPAFFAGEAIFYFLASNFRGKNRHSGTPFLRKILNLLAYNWWQGTYNSSKLWLGRVLRYQLPHY